MDAIEFLTPPTVTLGGAGYIRAHNNGYRRLRDESLPESCARQPLFLGLVFHNDHLEGLAVSRARGLLRSFKNFFHIPLIYGVGPKLAHASSAFDYFENVHPDPKHLSFRELKENLVGEMVETSELDWIVQKTTELLTDKVKDAPLTDRDIELAFEMFAKPRLERLSNAFKNDLERRQAQDFIMMKLQERAKQLNAEHWQKLEI